MAKVNVNGPEASDLWKILNSTENYYKQKKTLKDWTKFLLNKDGIPIQRFQPD